MIVFEQKKQELLQLFQETINFSRERQNDEMTKHLAKLLQHLQEGQLYVIVCGEFKKGKSSFINALLNERNNLCPVDVDVTTSVVTTLAYGETEKITAVLGKTGEEATQEKPLQSREQIRDYVTEQGNPHNQRKVRLLAVQLPNQQLKSGLVLVDTPGVGGLNSEHTDVTSAFLPNADVALFISDAHTPLSELELDFIKDRIARHCPDILFVVTKKDQNAQFQVIVDDNRQKLAAKLDRPADKIIIIPVSSLLKRDYLEYQDEDALKTSNFIDLEKQLWKHLNDGRGAILLLKGSIELGKSLGELRLPIQAELTGYQEKDKQRLAELERGMQEKNKRLKDLLDKNPQWHGLLRDRLVDVQDRIAEEFRQGFAEIRQNVEHYLDNKAMRNNPEQIVYLLQADMGGLLAEIQKNLEADAATLQDTLERESRLNLNPYRDMLALNTSSSLAPKLLKDKTGLWSKSLEVARNASSTGVAGATVLGLLGGIVGGTVGLFAGGIGAIPGAYWGATIGGALGQIAGMATGTSRSIQQMGQRNRAEVARYLLNFVSEQQENLGGKLRTSIKEMERFLRNDFTDQLSREKRSVEEALLGLQNARMSNQNQSKERIAALSLQLQRLQYLQQRLDQILKTATETLSEETAAGNSSQHGADNNTVHEGWADE